MTIPTREELIARWAMYPGCTLSAIADFTLSEIRRALIDEMEVMADAQLTAHHSVMACIGRRTNALRAQDGHEQRACSPDGTSSARKGVQEGDGKSENPGASPGKPTSESPAGNVAAPALSDAEVFAAAQSRALSEAAAILDERGGKPTLAAILRDEAAKIIEEAKPMDAAFRAFERAYDGQGDERLQELARDWFFPLVAALEQIEDDSYEEKTVGLASAALESLRRKAGEARS